MSVQAALRKGDARTLDNVDVARLLATLTDRATLEMNRLDRLGDANGEVDHILVHTVPSINDNIANRSVLGCLQTKST